MICSSPLCCRPWMKCVSRPPQRVPTSRPRASDFRRQATLSQFELLRSSVDLATESLRLTVLRYQAGEATALEVVDAQNTVTQARNAYDDGLARYRIALASVQILTGTL